MYLEELITLLGGPGKDWVDTHPTEARSGHKTFFLPLFTGVRGIGILGSSPLALCIAPVLYSRSSYVE
jgi:hypothetical protein